MQSFNSLSEQEPPALRAVYLIEEANKSIQLYQGSLEMTQKGSIKQGNGTVHLEWFPSPKVKFNFSYHDGSSPIEIDKACLKLSEIGTSAEVSILGIAFNFDCEAGDDLYQISGIFRDPIILGSEQNLSYLLFHLTNFQDFCGSSISRESRLWSGRFILEAEGWSVTIDSLESLGEIKKSLEAHGGYAITHVGKLKRSNKEAFTPQEGEDFLEAIRYFLSFSRGFRISPILLVGYNPSGGKVWEKWDSKYITTSWREVTSLFPFFPRKSRGLGAWFAVS